ncbi:MAG: hypothetical protein JWM58_1577 [Rhizobium sp.]|nr:hypothetical protein [Rhizobium sp.]
MAKVISDGKDAVDQFLRTLDHPRQSDIETLRSIILDADPAISEKVKWNAPSFYFRDDFATMKLRPDATLQLIMHTGAKTRQSAICKSAIEDSNRLLTWVADDRCVITFDPGEDVLAKPADLQNIVRQWIALI